MRSYSQFMIIEIAKGFDVIDEHLEYDEMWVKGAGLLKQFEESEFNVDTKSEHDCMVDFMYEKQQEIKRRKEEERRKKIEGNRTITINVNRTYSKYVEVKVSLPKSLTLDECQEYVETNKALLKQIEDELANKSLEFQDSHSDFNDDYTCNNVGVNI